MTRVITRHGEIKIMGRDISLVWTMGEEYTWQQKIVTFTTKKDKRERRIIDGIIHHEGLNK